MENNPIKTKFGTARIGDIGYYRISSHKEGNYGKLLHRLIYADHYDIVLGSDVIIHHLDGNKTNNDISNLITMTNSEHIRQHQLGENNNNYGGLSDENKLNLSKSVNTTGYFRVVKHIKKDVLRSTEMSDEGKLQYLEVLKEQLKSN